MQIKIYELRVGELFRLVDSPYTFRLTDSKNLLGHYKAVYYLDSSIDIYLEPDILVYLV